LGKFWSGPRLENVDIFYGHLEYLTDVWDILSSFGTFCVHLVHFSGLGNIYREKSGNPGQRTRNASPTFLFIGSRCVNQLSRRRNADVASDVKKLSRQFSFTSKHYLSG
jgi:hypothetical protein